MILWAKSESALYLRNIALAHLLFLAEKLELKNPLILIRIGAEQLDQRERSEYPSLALELMSSGVAEFLLLTELCDSIPERGELNNTWKEKEKELHTCCNTWNGRTIRKSSVKFSLPELIYSLSKRYSFQ